MKPSIWMRVNVSEPLIVSAGGIPYNKPHLDALAAKVDEQDAEIEELRAALWGLLEFYDDDPHDPDPWECIKAARRALEGQ